MQEIGALRDEARDLLAVVSPFDPEAWWRPTPFKGWSSFDVVAHLHEADRLGLVAATDPDAFRHLMRERRAAPPRPDGELPRERAPTRDPGELLKAWSDTLEALCSALARRSPEDRIPWGGPDMSATSFASARLMEVWAHAQDIYDLLKRPRSHTDRVKPIAELGVRTFRWTFANRKLECPDVRPFVALTSPSGASWTWNPPNETERVEGSAVEFCQVVTQVRNVADTRLRLTGDAATRWMAIAQCFAGVPRDPPPPGSRAW